MKMKLKNVTKANQGVWSVDGELITVEPGDTRTVNVRDVARVRRQKLFEEVGKSEDAEDADLAPKGRAKR